ncbi:hypothetical protein F4604DRAFT_1927135 [Suillus subluteus]|nr:hypothetical protein F4604DRAFT_1927135 [Suillus subluteus]
MPAEDISKLPLSTQPPNSVAISTTPPTHHMNTDSRANKHNRPTSPNAAPNPQSGGNVPQPSPNNQQSPTSGNTFNPPCPLLLSVRTLDSGFRITTTPAGGFPTPQLSQSTWHNISQILKEKWPQKEGTKVWVHTYRAKYESNAQGTVAKLKDAIIKIIGESDTESLVVSTPTAAVELIERLPPPWHFLVSGVPPEAIEHLVCLQVCSSPEISCFFVPFKQPLPTYAFTLENFSSGHTVIMIHLNSTVSHKL